MNETMILDQRRKIVSYLYIIMTLGTFGTVIYGIENHPTYAWIYCVMGCVAICLAFWMSGCCNIKGDIK